MNEDRRDYEGYRGVRGMILSANAMLGMFAALLAGSSSLSMFFDPSLQGAYAVMGALGTALLGFTAFALVVVLILCKRHERWAW